MKESFSEIAEFIISNITGMLAITVVYVAILATWMVANHDYPFLRFITNQRGNLMSSIFVGIVTGIITGYVITMYFNKRDKEAASREKEKEIKRDFKGYMNETWKYLLQMSVNLTSYIHILENFGEEELGLQKVLFVRDIRLTDTQIDENYKKLMEFEIVAFDNVKEKFKFLYESLIDVKIALVTTIFPENDARNKNRGKLIERDRYKITLEKANEILESVDYAINKYFSCGAENFEVRYKKHSE